MAPTPLDSLRHRTARVRLPDLAHALRQNHAILGLEEVPAAAADYPLAFMKRADTGRFNLIALFGYTSDRNLFVADGRWRATYMPLATLRYPFFAATQGVHGLAIDECSACVDAAAGDRLFDDSGAATAYTVRIASMLQSLQRSFEEMQTFAQTLAELQLIRPLCVRLRYEDGRETMLDGLYGVASRVLIDLPAAEILVLHRRGYLATMHVMSASLQQLERLRQLHDAQLQPRIREISAGVLE